MYLISVYFDEKSNKILQGYIDKIADKTGNTFMTDNSVPPHLTIAALEARSVEVLIPAFDELFNRLDSGEIYFASVGQLLPYVMYAAPVLNSYLQGMIENVYDSVKNIEDVSVSRFYKPHNWLPHVTLGKKLDNEQMLKAFEIMQKSFVPFTARVVEIGLAKVNPHEDVRRYVL